MKRILVTVCVALAAPFHTAAHAQARHAETLASRAVAPGVSYRALSDDRGPWLMHVLRIDLRRADLAIQHVRAHDQLRGRERTSEMARRLSAAGVRVLAAVNSDFFELASGENENNQVIDGEWWKGLKVTDSPYDSFDNPHVQLAFDARGRPMIDRFVLEGQAWTRGVATPIMTVNFAQIGTMEGTTLYTPRYGDATHPDTTRATVQAPMVTVGRRGDTLLYVRRGVVSSQARTAIPTNGAVLAAYGAGLRSTEVKAMAEGDTVRVLLTVLPRVSHGVAPRTLLGGWPRILRDGVDVTRQSATLEGTLSRNAELRHPRTAAGFSRDSATLILVVVDGRSARSVGMTLGELATAMRALGAWQAINFDGGGSSTMLVGGRVVNVPSDSAGERTVGNALFVVGKSGRRRQR
ncbi:MAG: phosphodiester glycosidase family protein [Gemmatimonadaceae bacterium]